MKISWIKSKNDTNSFEFIKSLGGNVYEVNEPENIDLVMNTLCNNEGYNTIVISNELAGFSEDIIKKYNNTKDIRIIIVPSKNR